VPTVMGALVLVLVSGRIRQSTLDVNNLERPILSNNSVTCEANHVKSETLM